jgi:hypothetical protein
MQWRSSEVPEDEHHVEVFERELHSFQRCDFDFSQGHHSERWLGKVDKAFCGGLHLDTSTRRNSFKCELPEWDIDFESRVRLECYAVRGSVDEVRKT